MKTLIIFAFVILAFPGFCQIADHKKSFEQLQQLEGLWLMKTSKGFLGEEWKKTNEQLLSNRGFRIKGLDTTVTETVALEYRDNNIFYTSTVSGQNNQQPITFTLTSAFGNKFVFENPSHDYPKRITYHLLSKDSLSAWIDDGNTEPAKEKVFNYTRAH
ncbi:MAG: DUF6265 family protein [Ferruginibacter sp.]|nr:DUF6265 family protein [Ferruginibacter sp.]